MSISFTRRCVASKGISDSEYLRFWLAMTIVTAAARNEWGFLIEGLLDWARSVWDGEKRCSNTEKRQRNGRFCGFGDSTTANGYLRKARATGSLPRWEVFQMISGDLQCEVEISRSSPNGKKGSDTYV